MFNSWKNIILEMFIFWQISCYLEPTIKEIPRPNWLLKTEDDETLGQLWRLIWSRLNSYLATPPIAKMICVKNGRATPKQLPKCFFHVFSIFVFILFRYETPYSMTRVNLNKSNKVLTFITTRSKDIPTRTRICSNRNFPFQT